MASEGNKKSKCANCGKCHTGQCLKGTNKCYTCGREGHTRKGCLVFVEFVQQQAKTAPQSSGTRRLNLPCPNCGRYHREDREDVCYKCEQVGH